MDPARYAELFRSESQDQLQAISRALLVLDAGHESPAAVAEVFRAVHTIKGMSATMGYQSVAEFAHELESRLDRIRGAGARVTRPMVDALFAAVDALEAGIGAASETAHRTEAMVASLSRLSGAFPEVASSPADDGGENARPGAPARSVMTVPAEAAGDDAAVDPFDGPGVIVRIRQAATTSLPGVRIFMIARNLGSLGEIAAVSPPMETLQAAATPQGFAIRLVTDATMGEIEAAVRAAGDIESVQVDMAGRARKRPTPMAAAAIVETSSARARQVRIDLARLDTMMNLAGELMTARGRLLQVAATSADPVLDEVAQQVASLAGELQAEITASRMVPVGQVFDRFPRMVRDAARSLGKEVRFEVEGREIELDRALLDEMSEPLVHLLRNALDHGLEGPDERVAAGKPAVGTLLLSASRDRSGVVVMVADDGGGIDRARVLERARGAGLVEPGIRELSDTELLRCIAHPGFSMKESVTGLSGRGVGVDAVVNRVRELSGAVDLQTVLGAGSCFTIRLPASIAIVKAILARAGRERYVLPLAHVRETLAVEDGVVRHVGGRDELVLRDESMPLFDLCRMVRTEPARVGEREIVVVERGGRRAGLVVDELVGQEDVVVKSFEPARGDAETLALFSGATILGDGAPALIMDIGSLL